MPVNAPEIERRRVALGLTRPQVARQIERTPISLYCYERGRRNPPPEVVEALAVVFGCTAEDLLTGDPA